MPLNNNPDSILTCSHAHVAHHTTVVLGRVYQNIGPDGTEITNIAEVRALPDTDTNDITCVYVCKLGSRASKPTRTHHLAPIDRHPIP